MHLRLLTMMCSFFYYHVGNGGFIKSIDTCIINGHEIKSQTTRRWRLRTLEMVANSSLDENVFSLSTWPWRVMVRKGLRGVQVDDWDGFNTTSYVTEVAESGQLGKEYYYTS